MILTFGLAIIIENTMLSAWTPDERLITTAYSSKAIFLGEIIIKVSNLLGFLLSGLGIAAIHLFLHRTRTGKAVRATWQDPEGAALQGINLRRVSMIAFGLALASAGAGGVAMACMYSFNPLRPQPLAYLPFSRCHCGRRGKHHRCRSCRLNHRAHYRSERRLFSAAVD
jgi:branched-chain amino acid transport system permease protein